MILIILVALILLCGVGGWSLQPPYRYGVGGLGLVLFVLFCLDVLGIIHP